MIFLYIYVKDMRAYNSYSKQAIATFVLAVAVICMSRVPNPDPAPRGTIHGSIDCARAPLQSNIVHPNWYGW